jgi:type II restriction/modification system DNA methylase subunit YeeA
VVEYRAALEREHTLGQRQHQIQIVLHDLRTILGGEYVDRIFNAYAGRVPAEADLVTYWFAKAWELMRASQLTRAGLVATNSIRGGANRRVLEPITNDGIIFDAWDDEAWVVDGAAVRVSIICFASGAALVGGHGGRCRAAHEPDCRHSLRA